MASLEHLLFGDSRDPREELAEIFDVPVPKHAGVQPEALAWARTVIDPAATDEVAAIAALRDAEPRLGLKSATYLVQRVYAQQ